MDKIADGLMADGILTGAGKTKWHTSTINKILRNEKYMGDALLQKTYTTDFLTKKRIKNNGTVPPERDFFLKTLQQNIAKAVVNADTLSPDGIQARLEELQKELIKKATNKQDYDAIADEIFRLRDQKEQSELDSHHREEAMNRIKELQDFISGQESDITEFDEALVKKLIEKITVFADHFTMEFKSGITIDIEA